MDAELVENTSGLLGGQAGAAGLGGLLAPLRALGVSRLAALAIAAVTVLGLLALMVLRGQQNQMALLYGDLETRDSAAVVEALERAHIPYELRADASRILVPADQVARLRLTLAREGLPSGGSVGYEIFDRGDALTSTQFQQEMNLSRALEGELARSIRTISGVRAARVHLVLPRHDPFERNKQEAQASVLLSMTGAARLDREGVQAVLNLISAAVPGLRAQNIAIIDSRGDLLARAGQPTDAAGNAQSADELRRATELRIARGVEELLERSLGTGHVRAEAAVDLDTERMQETQEKYDPDNQVTRSEQSVTDSSRNTEPSTAVSVQNNLPNADPAPGAAGAQTAHQEGTTNYEIGKTVRTLIRDQPQLRRLSVAVMVDAQEVRAPDGSVSVRDRSPEELARLTALVRGAIGYDEKRGDHVEVVSMRFTPPDSIAEPTASRWLALDKADFLRLGESGLLALIALLAIMLVARPVALRLAAAPGRPLAIAGGGAGSTSADLGNDARAAAPGDDPMVEDAMVQVARVEGAVRAASVRRIAQLAEAHPEETLSMVRRWMLDHEEA